jgi:predicted outer membrane repeat protein
LEDRWVPATLKVTDLLNAGPGSLRAEIAAARNGDTIMFVGDARVGTIVLQSQLFINKNITITGSGSSNLTIEGQTPVLGNGLRSCRAFEIALNRTVTIQKLTINNGCAPLGTDPNGGGIKVDPSGTLFLSQCDVSFNTAANGGGIWVGSNGLLNLRATAVEFNRASTGNGGGIAVDGGKLTIAGAFIKGQLQSDVSKNTAEQYGGGVWFSGSGEAAQTMLSIDQTNFTNNTAGSSGGGLYSTWATGSTKPPVDISYATFTGNTATAAFGGGIYVGANTKFGEGVSVLNSKAGLPRGIGVYEAPGVKITGLDGVTVKGNAELPAPPPAPPGAMGGGPGAPGDGPGAPGGGASADIYVDSGAEFDMFDTVDTPQFESDGTVVPGNQSVAASLTFTGNYTQDSGGALDINLGGGSSPVAGVDYSQIVVTGSGDLITLAGALNVSLMSDFNPSVGTTYTIVDNQTGQAIDGIFAGLPEGAQFSIDGWTFQISYLGSDSSDGSTNDVILTVVGTPTSGGSISGQITAAATGADGPSNPPLAGVSVALLDANSNTLATTTTDANGQYSFSSLNSGTYTVAFTAPSGYLMEESGTSTWSSSVTTQGSGAVVNATAYQPATVSGTIFVDADGLGTPDSNNPGLPGVTVALVNDSQTVVSTTTDSNGDYSFSNVAPGSSVQVTEPTGYSLEGSTTTTWTTPVATQSGTVTINEGVYQPATVTGTVGQVSSQTGLSGVTVTLSDDNGNTFSTTTASDGTYSISGLAPGFYTAQFTAPSGYVMDGNSASWYTGISVGSGQTLPNVNATAYSATATATVSGNIFVDLDGSGVPDTSNSGVSGVAVNLLDASGNIILSTNTDNQGNFVFTNLQPGTYTVQFTTPSGYLLEATSTSTFAAAVNAPSPDAPLSLGMFQPVAVGGTVTLGITGTGLGGVTVTLLDVYGNVVGTTTTATDGTYSFGNDLLPGSYTVQVTAPSGYVIGDSSSTWDESVTVGSGQTLTDINTTLGVSVLVSTHV